MQKADVHYVHQLSNSVHALGLKLPAPMESVTDRLEATDAVWNATRPHEQLATDIRSGKYPTAKKLADAYRAAAADAAMQEAARGMRSYVHTELGVEFVRAYQDGGDQELTEALRGIFNPAAAAITEAANWITPSTTPDQIVEMEDPAAALAAWRDLPKHQAVLNQVDSVVGMLVDHFGVVPKRDWGPYVSRAAFYVGSEGPRDLRATARAYGTGTSTRGGRWLRMVGTCQLALRSGAEATELLDEYLPPVDVESAPIPDSGLVTFVEDERGVVTFDSEVSA